MCMASESGVVRERRRSHLFLHIRGLSKLPRIVRNQVGIEHGELLEVEETVCLVVAQDAHWVDAEVRLT